MLRTEFVPVQHALLLILEDLVENTPQNLTTIVSHKWHSLKNESEYNRVYSSSMSCGEFFNYLAQEIQVAHKFLSIYGTSSSNQF